MNEIAVFASLLIQLSFADGLPSVGEAAKAPQAPIKIQATGKRERLEKTVDGKPHGEGRYYHPNGQLYTVLQWDHGKKDGKFKLFREDGTLEEIQEFRGGKPNGLLIWLHENESIKEFAEYVDGISFGVSKCVNPVVFSEIERHEKGMRATLFEKCMSTDQLTPSFDCKLAQSKSEKLVCLDQRLMLLDRLMNFAYTAALKKQTPEKQKTLKLDQRAWLKEREKCAGFSDVDFSKKCVLNSIATRIRQIRNFDSVPEIKGKTI